MPRLNVLFAGENSVLFGSVFHGEAEEVAAKVQKNVVSAHVLIDSSTPGMAWAPKPNNEELSENMKTYCPKISKFDLDTY